MYTLYKNQKRIGIIQIFIAVLLLIGIDMLLFSAREQIGVTGTVVCIILWDMICVIAIILGCLNSKADPYRQLKIRYQQEPGLKEKMEQDFLSAENIGNKVWIGETYLFVKEDYQFKVLEMDAVYDLKKNNVATLRGGRIYSLLGKCGNQRFSVSMSEKNVEYAYGRLTL